MTMTIGKTYLLGYNIAQTFGWSVILLQSVWCFATGKDLWTVVSAQLKVFQTLALLEVVHTSVGLVRSSPVLTGFQVSSRIFALWAILNYSAEARASIGFPLLLVSWCLAEIVRYAFYAMNLLTMDFYPLVWLRYTVFIVLYPTGVTGELVAMYSALSKVAAEQPLTLDMPNRFNVAFSSYVALICIMVSYIPVFPVLYSHMLSQRKKALSPQIKKNI